MAGSNLHLLIVRDPTTLFDACREDDWESVNRLLQQGADPNITDRYGNTPLHFASVNCRVDTMQLLLNSGAKLNALNNNGKTPLDTCLSAGRHAYTGNHEYLINLGAKSTSNDGNTRLHLAAKNGGANLIEHILREGGDVNSKNNEGETPMECAVSSRNSTAVKILLEKGGVDVNRRYGKNQETVLHMACRMGEPRMVELLIEQGSNVNAKAFDGNTPLHFACDNLQCIRALLDFGADKNAKNQLGYKPWQCSTSAYEAQILATQKDRLKSTYCKCVIT